MRTRTDMRSDNPKDCPRCGQAHERCAGHNRAGNPCKKHPLEHQRVCELHGGKSPRALAAATRKGQEIAAREAVATYGLPVDISPTEALLEEVRWTAGHVQWLRARVQELETAALVWGTTRTETEVSASQNHADNDEVPDASTLPSDKVIQTARPTVWLDLYDRERKHLIAVCSAALKAGVEERRVRLAESQGELVAGAIRAILTDLGLTAEQQARVSEVVPRHLRLLAGGAA